MSEEFLKGDIFYKDQPRYQTRGTFKYENLLVIEYGQDLTHNHNILFNSEPCNSYGFDFEKTRRFYFEDGMMVGNLYVLSKTKAEFSNDIYEKFVSSLHCRLSDREVSLRRKERIKKIYEEKVPNDLKEVFSAIKHAFF